jgi:hypothetical protein
LINSRRHQLSADECTARLDRLKKLREINPGLTVYLFMLIMRTSNFNNNSEEMDYWIDYGTSIWKLAFLSDKKSRTELDADEQKELDAMEKFVPAEILSDYTGRRKINLAVNLHALQLLKDGYITELIIPKDDNAEYGYSTRDHEAVATEVSRLSLWPKVMIYPGADEAGSTLLSRVLNQIKGSVPQIFTYYSSTLGPQIVAKYEDRPINESVKSQIVSAGCVTVDSSHDADIILMINTPGTQMEEAFDQNEYNRTYGSFRNLHDFIARLKMYIRQGKRCVVADIAYCNGSDNELLNLLIAEDLLDKLVGYGGWNTTANTLGVAILQGVAANFAGAVNIKNNRALFAVHVYKIVEDWAYQANVMVDVVTELEDDDIDCYALDDEAAAAVADDIKARLNRFIPERQPGLGDVRVEAVRLPWGRTFDVDMDVVV